MGKIGRDGKIVGEMTTSGEAYDILTGKLENRITKPSALSPRSFPVRVVAWKIGV